MQEEPSAVVDESSVVGTQILDPSYPLNITYCGGNWIFKSLKFCEQYAILTLQNAHCQLSIVSMVERPKNAESGWKGICQALP